MNMYDVCYILCVLGVSVCVYVMCWVYVRGQWSVGTLAPTQDVVR